MARRLRRVERLRRFREVTMELQPIGESELQRLASLNSFEIMDTQKEKHYDDIVRLAADICECPAACITFIGEQDTFFKSTIGLGNMCGTSRTTSLCDYTIRSNDLSMVDDATKDERFVLNPLVTPEDGLRFYAGAPLIDERTGQAVGALCAIDFKPRNLTSLQQQMLQLLARQLVTTLESRRRIKELDETQLN